MSMENGSCGVGNCRGESTVYESFDLYLFNSDCLTVCSQRVCLLKLLRSPSLPIQQLHMVFMTLILSWITYTLPAWGLQLTRQPQERMDAFLKRAREFGFCYE